MGKVKLKKLKTTSAFRKIAMGTWRTVGDPSVYAIVYINMQKALAGARAYSEKHEIKISPTHLVSKAMAHCLHRRPEINGMIRGSRIYLRENVSLFLQVNIPKTEKDGLLHNELSGCTIHEAEKMNIKQIAKAINAKRDIVVSEKPNELTTSMNVVKLLPWWLIRIYLDLGSFLIYGLNLNLSFLGFPKDPFGSVMITNAGSLGTDLALAPIVPYSRTPLLITVGAIRETAVVEDHQVVARPVMPIGVTFDHRFIDGAHGAQMNADFKKCFEEPEKYLFHD